MRRGALHRRPFAWSLGQRAALGLGVLLAACGDDRLAEQAAAAREAPPPVAAAVYVVQLGSYADSAAAARVARALVDSGWAPVVHPAPVGGARRWRVYVAPSTDDRSLPELMAAGVRVTGGEALVVRDTFAPGQFASNAHGRAVSVNQGSPGMAARVRWALSPDSTSLMAVEDPAGVENEPVPNGFVFASELLDCYLQADSVWDVAPSPDWTRVAYGRAYRVPGAANPEPPDSAWPALAARVGLAADSVRRGSFAASGMSSARAFAQPVVVDLPAGLAPDTDGGPRALRRHTLPMAGGWRVRWTPDGRTLAVGANPRRAQDDETPGVWLGVRDTEPTGRLDAATVRELAATAWVRGPTLDPSLPVDLTRRGAGADGTRITNVGGWIRASDGAGGFRIVGPGVALAATRTGRFVLALAPHPDALRDAPTAQLVVYATAAGTTSAPGACDADDVSR